MNFGFGKQYWVVSRCELQDVETDSEIARSIGVSLNSEELIERAKSSA